MSSNLQSQLYSSLDSQNRSQATRIPDIHEQILNSSSSPDSQERQEQIVKLVTDAAKHEPQELFEYVQKSTDSYTRKYWTLKVIYILINGCHIAEACETFTSIFDFICSEFSTAELDSEGKVLWLSVAKRLIRWEGCLYQKILDSSVCLLSSNEEETVIEVFMDFLYLIGQQENFTAHFSFFKKEKEQLLLVLCRLFRQTSGTNSEKKLLQNLQEKIKSSSDFIHFCKFLARQVEYAPGEQMTDFSLFSKTLHERRFCCRFQSSATISGRAATTSWRSCVLLRSSHQNLAAARSSPR